MKRVTLLIITTLVAFTMAVNGATTATSVLDQTADKLTKARSVTAEYTITSGAGKDKGKIILASGKFTLTSSTLRTWYDGLTLWTYSPDLGEVNITHPTSEELLQINPFAIISTYKQHYTAKLLNTQNKDTYSVELTPKTKEGTYFSKALITVDATTYFPREVKLILQDKSTVNIEVNSVTTGTLIGQQTFVFDQSDAPDAEIVDLR